MSDIGQIEELRSPKFLKVCISDFGQLEELKSNQDFIEYSLLIKQTQQKSRIFESREIALMSLTSFVECPKIQPKSEDSKSENKIPLIVNVLARKSVNESFLVIARANFSIKVDNLTKDTKEIIQTQELFIPMESSKKIPFVVRSSLPQNDNDTFTPIQQFQIDDFTNQKLKYENEYFALSKVFSEKANSKYFLKEFKKMKEENNQLDVKITVNDIMLAQGLTNYQTLLKIVGYVTLNDESEIVTHVVYEYMKCYTLRDLISMEDNDKQPEKYNNTYKSFIMFGITHALSTLHANGVAFDHLQPEFILVDKQTFNVKLYDYEVSSQISGKKFAGILYDQDKQYVPPFFDSEEAIRQLQKRKEEREKNRSKSTTNENDNINDTKNNSKENSEEEDTHDEEEEENYVFINRFGDDIYSLGLVFFEIASNMKKDRTTNDDVKYLSSNLRCICHQMWMQNSDHRPRIEEILYLIKNGNCIIFETKMNLLTQMINNLENLGYENIHHIRRADMLSDLYKYLYGDRKLIPTIAGLYYVYENKSTTTDFLLNGIKQNNIFCLALFSHCLTHGTHEVVKNTKKGSELLSVAMEVPSQSDYHYGIVNFDEEEPEKVDKFTSFWQFQQLRTGMRDATIYYNSDDHQKVYPQYKTTLNEVSALLFNDIMIHNALLNVSSDDKDFLENYYDMHIDSCVALSQIIQLPECAIKEEQLFMALMMKGVVQSNTVSLGLIVNLCKVKKWEKENEEYGRIGSAHNFNYILSDLSSFLFDRSRYDEAYHYAYKGALNFNASCELVVGLICHQRNDLENAKRFILRAKEHGDSRASSILGRLFLMNDDADAAEKYLVESSEDTTKELLSLYLKSKQYGKAINLINERFESRASQVAFFDFLHKEFEDEYVDVLKVGVEMNNIVAMHKYGIYLVNFQKSDENYKKARDLFEKCIENDMVSSYFALAQLTHEYFKDNETAFKLAQQGAEKGDPYAKCLVGSFIAKGIGTTKDFEKGIEMVLETDCIDYYMHTLAGEIARYYIAKKELDKALKIYKAGAALGNNECIVYLGSYYLNNNKYEEGFKLFEQAYNNEKNRGTINNYGICFLNGIGVEKDWEKAKVIFKEGVELDDCNCMYHLAYIYENEDPQKSLKYYIMAADRGEVHAQQYLIEKFQKDGNNEQCLKYLKMHANSGNPTSQMNLAIWYMRNNEMVNAFTYFGLAAMRGIPEAIYFYSTMLFKGEGCEKDKDTAVKMLTKLAQSGLKLAQEFLDENCKENTK
ncbi:hypothetical protein TRFO_16334 [Tritrichomonas foetus]|uniref:Protein kinase domain-containing protein n=1 Tax=Tritrichomonas foetus TaxID=1144522 RepID=A0A1J4KUW3_9EUKA|nr:hypothetical protein TRFO_16334 [Tritrichomonas foetus]|eukprot:OHT13470.1 hypothetical protein TRFO_16334 [Tritrichomonas foetus]